MNPQVITENKVDLINGQFTPAEAAEILMHLMDKKINFHELKNFSELERNGKDNEASVRRIAELMEAKDILKSKIDEAKLKGKNLRINSSIDISFE